jgi:hypothetical protein
MPELLARQSMVLECKIYYFNLSRVIIVAFCIYFAGFFLIYLFQTSLMILYIGVAISGVGMGLGVFNIFKFI